jgi:hypothetical protein
MLMWQKLRVVVLMVGVGCAVGWLAPPASADDGDRPQCPLSLALMCRLLPVAPDMDGDLDLTTNQPAPGPQEQLPPPVDPCAMTRCI